MDGDEREILLIKGFDSWKSTVISRFGHASFSGSSDGEFVTAYRKLSNGKNLRIGYFLRFMGEGHIFDRRIVDRVESG